MKPVVAIISYGALSSLIEENTAEFLEFVEIKMIKALMEDALKIVVQMEERREADVFVCSGNSPLPRYIKSPFVEIKVTGFDLLFALKKAKEYSNQVAVITHHNNKIEYLNELADMFSIDIRHINYSDIYEAEAIVKKLKGEGIKNVIGPGIVIEIGKKLGMNSILIYSADAVKAALKTAVSIALSKQEESAKAQRFSVIMDFAHEGIVATDRFGKITVINPKAKKILNAQQATVGNSVQNIFSNNKIFEVIQSGKAEINQIQTIGDVKIVTNMIPIVVNNEIAGAVATFQDIGSIQEAEEKIRKKIYEKGLVAKSTLDDILGNSQEIMESKNKALLYAKSESTVLITGESGTGKELFAQGIHNASNRANHAFVAINCQALPDNLLESELFGYDEGAFTGAKRGGKPGFFELAHGGTIFLDEIGEISPRLQSRLLRVLEEREVMRVGSSKIIPINIRVIAATNINLWERVTQGKFREDLYYRLNVLELEIPPLRMRKQDIPLLVEKFLKGFKRDIDEKTIKNIAQHPAFLQYDWPGNIRELKNFLERFMVLYTENTRPEELLEKIFAKYIKREWKLSPEYIEINRVLQEVKGNKSEAAKRLGISRTTLWKKLKKNS